MPTYCKAGQKARVFFTYPNQTQDNVSVPSGPVTVTSETATGGPLTFTGGQCQTAYFVRFTVMISYFGGRASPEPRELVAYGKVVSLTLYNGPPDSPSVNRVRLVYLDQNGNSQFADATGGNYPNIVWQEVRNVTCVRADNLPDNCGDRQFEQPPCTFTVKDADGVVRFAKTAEQCPSFSVVCGGNCPPGTVECCGCCLPCGSTKSEIRALVNQIRGM